MKHEPRRLLGDAERPMNLPRGDAVLAVGNHPHHRKPLLQAKRRVLKHRSCLDAELGLRMASLALPEMAGRDVGCIRATARRADHASAPAPSRKKLDAVIGIGEVPDGFGKCLRLLHEPNHRTFGLMSQVYFYPFGSPFSR